MSDEFYDKGVDVGRIKDVGTAQELAEIEGKFGHDARITRETELKTGLTQVQMDNMRVMNELLEAFPEAFYPDQKNNLIHTGTKGQFLVLMDVNVTNPTMVLSIDGSVSVQKSLKSAGRALSSVLCANSDLSSAPTLPDRAPIKLSDGSEGYVNRSFRKFTSLKEGKEEIEEIVKHTIEHLQYMAKEHPGIKI